MLLSITVSPGVKALALSCRGSAALVQMYGEAVYAAVVSRWREVPLEDREALAAAKALVRLMDAVGRAAGSRYYTFTGPLELGERVVYRPYVAPTSTATVEIRGRRVRVEVSDVGVRRKGRAKVELQAALARLAKALDCL